MSKRARHPPGFYAALLNDACDNNYKSKYRPIAEPTVLGLFDFERVVAKRIQGRETAYFVQWKNYSPEDNKWEPADHLPGEFVVFAAFENRSVDVIRADECRERLALLFEKGLKSPLACNETITMRHDVLRAIFPGLSSDLRRTPYLVSEEELISTGLGFSLKKCVTVTGGGCLVVTPVSV